MKTTTTNIQTTVCLHFIIFLPHVYEFDLCSFRFPDEKKADAKIETAPAITEIRNKSDSPMYLALYHLKIAADNVNECSLFERVGADLIELGFGGRASFQSSKPESSAPANLRTIVVASVWKRELAPVLSFGQMVTALLI
jgi:hypothetical protein